MNPFIGFIANSCALMRKIDLYVRARECDNEVVLIIRVKIVLRA